MKLTKKIFLTITAISLSALPLYSSDDTDIPVEDDPVKKNDPEYNRNRDYLEPPYCRFSKERREVSISFDYYCGNATITVTSADGQSWAVTQSTMFQPMVCPFSGSPGAYTLSITTTSGLAFLGHFTVD